MIENIIIDLLKEDRQCLIPGSNKVAMEDFKSQLYQELKKCVPSKMDYFSKGGSSLECGGFNNAVDKMNVNLNRLLERGE